mmetsp:Transcript_6386/g.24009  ORF Transcript_6386/g.24009 Transcript_6386/m.24009 type:complete len:81 (-) Transcript_6386:1334-1576(-)
MICFAHSQSCQRSMSTTMRRKIGRNSTRRERLAQYHVLMVIHRQSLARSLQGEVIYDPESNPIYTGMKRMGFEMYLEGGV